MTPKELQDRLNELTESAVKELRVQIPDASVKDLIAVINTTTKISQQIEDRLVALDGENTEGSSMKLSPAAQKLMASRTSLN